MLDGHFDEDLERSDRDRAAAAGASRSLVQRRSKPLCDSGFVARSRPRGSARAARRSHRRARPRARHASAEERADEHVGRVVQPAVDASESDERRDHDREHEHRATRASRVRACST